MGLVLEQLTFTVIPIAPPDLTEKTWKWKMVVIQ